MPLPRRKTVHKRRESSKLREARESFEVAKALADYSAKRDRTKRSSSSPSKPAGKQATPAKQTLKAVKKKARSMAVSRKGRSRTPPARFKPGKKDTQSTPLASPAAKHGRSAAKKSGNKESSKKRAREKTDEEEEEEEEEDEEEEPVRKAKGVAKKTAEQRTARKRAEASGAKGRGRGRPKQESSSEEEEVEPNSKRQKRADHTADNARSDGKRTTLKMTKLTTAAESKKVGMEGKEPEDANVKQSKEGGESLPGKKKGAVAGDSAGKRGGKRKSDSKGQAHGMAPVAKPSNRGLLRLCLSLEAFRARSDDRNQVEQIVPPGCASVQFSF